jgi:uncharacterized protein
LYVGVDGTFHICEKINDKFPIGNVESGFDFSKMIAYINEYIGIIKKYCLTCEINCLCMRCFVNFARDGRFEIDKEFCENNIYTTKKMIEELIIMKEAETGGLR